MTRGRVSRNSRVPYYQQLRRILASGIDEGRWLPGHLLPSESELISSYQISRTVIRKALDGLSNEGRIRRIRGRGTVVLKTFLWDTSPELSGRYDALVASYRIRSVIGSRLTNADDGLAAKLEIASGTPVLEVTVVSERSDGPVVVAMLSTFVIAGDARPALNRLTRAGRTPRFRLGGPSIPVQLTSRFGLQLSHSPATLSARNCSESDAEHLGVAAGTGLLCFEWQSHDLGGRVVLAGRSLMGTGARLRFVIRHDQAA